MLPDRLAGVETVPVDLDHEPVLEVGEIHSGDELGAVPYLHLKLWRGKARLLEQSENATLERALR